MPDGQTLRLVSSLAGSGQSRQCGVSPNQIGVPMAARRIIMQLCQYVVAYEEEPAGSDVADPRVRCGKPASIELESGVWCCPEHAEIIHDSLDRPDKPLHS